MSNKKHSSNLRCISFYVSLHYNNQTPGAFIRQFKLFILHKNKKALACVSQKTRQLYEPEKPFVKLRTAYSVKLVFSYLVKGIKIKITAKFRDTEHLRFEDTKRIMSPEKFRDFRETSPWPLFGLPESRLISKQLS